MWHGYRYNASGVECSRAVLHFVEFSRIELVAAANHGLVLVDEPLVGVAGLG